MRGFAPTSKINNCLRAESELNMASSIYRFRDKVAINPPEGPTFYLSKEAARAMGQQMLLIAADIDSKTFSESKVKTVDIPE